MQILRAAQASTHSLAFAGEGGSASIGSDRVTGAAHRDVARSKIRARGHVPLTLACPARGAFLSATPSSSVFAMRSLIRSRSAMFQNTTRGTSSLIL